MSLGETQAADVKGPRKGEIAVVAVTDTSSRTDLASALGGTFAANFITFVCDQDLYYCFGDSAEDTVAEDAVTGATRAAYVPAGQRVSEKPTGRYLVWLAADSGFLRIWQSSK